MKMFPVELGVSALIGNVLPEMVRDMSRLEVSHYDLPAEDLPEEFDGLKIVQLSDLHNKKYGKYNFELYKRICHEDPDIIVMTGDMISHNAPNMHDFIALVRMLCKKYPVYYVNGNHENSDMDVPTFKSVAARFEQFGAKCVDNAYVILKRGNASIRLCGLCYSARFYRGVRNYKINWSEFTLDDMVRYCGVKPKDQFTILLAHNPLDFDIHAEWGADISFGGHIHGGFIRLPLVGGIVSPELKLFPKYKEGVYKKGKSLLVVSRGLGRIRFFNPPELVSVTLHSKKKRKEK